MVQGWKLLEPLEQLDPARNIPEESVQECCDRIANLNGKLRQNVLEHLRTNKKTKWANAIEGEHQSSDDQLFKMYFANKAFSYRVPSNPPDPLDGCRAALVFHLSDTLQEVLLACLKGVPSSCVMNAARSANPKEFTRIFRYTNLRSMVSAIKSVQHDLEDFAFRAEDCLVGSDGSRFSARTDRWPYDSDLMDELVLLGFKRGPSPELLNSERLSSPVVAASMVRSHLEACLFRVDFRSALASQRPVEAVSWDDALRLHRKSGLLGEVEVMWAREAYSVLSRCIHTGLLLTRGEVWAMNRLVKLLRERIAEGSAATPHPS